MAKLHLPGTMETTVQQRDNPGLFEALNLQIKEFIVKCQNCK